MQKILRKLMLMAALVLVAFSASATPFNKCVRNGAVTYQQGPCVTGEVRKPPTVQELNDEEKRRRAALVTPSPGKAAPSTPAVARGFSCDGRRYCSQMTSCTEAKYFLANCPGVKMDGDRNGRPCEQQWCSN